MYIFTDLFFKQQLINKYWRKWNWLSFQLVRLLKIVNRFKCPVKHTEERDHVADLYVKRVRCKGSDGGQKRWGKKIIVKEGKGLSFGMLALSQSTPFQTVWGVTFMQVKKLEISTNVRNHWACMGVHNIQKSDPHFSTGKNLHWDNNLQIIYKRDNNLQIL